MSLICVRDCGYEHVELACHALTDSRLYLVLMRGNAFKTRRDRCILSVLLWLNFIRLGYSFSIQAMLP